MPYKGDRKEKNAKSREWYHKVGYGKHVCRNKKIRMKKIREWLIEYKSKLVCKCGESDIACLDFHHKDSSKKEITISKAIARGWSIRRLTEEIKKCEIMCSNCHMKLHFGERNDLDEKSIPELTEEERPKYLGRHGNGIKPKFKTLICDSCGIEFKIPLHKYNYKISNGQTKFYHNKSCAGKGNINEPPSNRKYTCDIKLVIKDGLNKGWTGYKIAKFNNLNKKTVYSWIKKIKDINCVGDECIGGVL
jgi:predicted DNA-binding protein YlxM (UPF0122 family)